MCIQDTRKIISSLLILATVFIALNCANPVSPTGGPKDTKPPALEKSIPPVYSINFNTNKIKIYFDEFIELKELNSQLIISPPMKKNPEIKIKGKSVTIEFKEELKANTTYNIFFGDAIVDITENNPASNFQYVFSTGNILDSLTIDGNVYNAFDLAPVEAANVMLYLDNNDTVVFDSVPYLLKPYYMTKTDANGNFTLNNLPGKSFKLFALTDVNSNLIYDQPNEEIAFIDSLIQPFYIKPVDTTITDSLSEHFLKIDTLVPDPIDLALFMEVDSTQKLLKAQVAQKNKLKFIFKRPVSNYNIRPLNLQVEDDWYIEEINETKDTLIYWLKNIEQDSLILEISDRNEVLDTAEIALNKKIRNKKKAKNEEAKIEAMDLKFSLKGGSADLNKPIIITFDYPVDKFDLSRISLLEYDTIPVYPDFSFIDSIYRKFKIEYEWHESTPYKLIIPDSTFFDIHKQSHDSVEIKFITKSLEDYGNLHLDLHLSEPGNNHIIQLLQNDKIVKELIIKEDQRFSFEYLAPGTYIIKVIYDNNNNGIWDAGNYIHKIQPEKVGFFPAEISIRENWDLEEEWGL